MPLCYTLNQSWILANQLYIFIFSNKFYFFGLITLLTIYFPGCRCSFGSQCISNCHNKERLHAITSSIKIRKHKCNKFVVTKTGSSRCRGKERGHTSPRGRTLWSSKCCTTFTWSGNYKDIHIRDETVYRPIKHFKYLIINVKIV